jgi:calcineurin-like phosphoesterase family protein
MEISLTFFMTDYFTSDYHFNHARMAEMRHFNTVQEMNQAIIDSHNAVVGEKDIVYFLGDFCFTHDWNELCYFYGELNGTFVWILGNHDDRKLFKKGFNESLIHDIYKYKREEETITLCHFPMRSWHKSHYNAWHLYGHWHMPTDFEGKSMNVGWDIFHKPIAYAEVKSYMDKRADNWDYDKKNGEAF